MVCGMVASPSTVKKPAMKNVLAGISTVLVLLLLSTNYWKIEEPGGLESIGLQEFDTT